MTSRREVEVDELDSTAQHDDVRRATLAVARVERSSNKEAVTDGVIRQLIDQIAQLQRASDAYNSRYVAVAAAGN